MRLKLSTLCKWLSTPAKSRDRISRSGIFTFLFFFFISMIVLSTFFCSFNFDFLCLIFNCWWLTSVLNQVENWILAYSSVFHSMPPICFICFTIGVASGFYNWFVIILLLTINEAVNLLFIPLFVIELPTELLYWRLFLLFQFNDALDNTLWFDAWSIHQNLSSYFITTQLSIDWKPISFTFKPNDVMYFLRGISAKFSFARFYHFPSVIKVVGLVTPELYITLASYYCIFSIAIKPYTRYMIILCLMKFKRNFHYENKIIFIIANKFMIKIYPEYVFSEDLAFC